MTKSKTRGTAGAPQQYFSTGYCCQILQCSPSELSTLMKKTGVRPAMEQNGIPYLDATGLQTLREAVLSRLS